MSCLVRPAALAALLVLLHTGHPAGALAEAKPVFETKRVTTQRPGHAVRVDADITGAKRLFLVVTDADDGYACDWADWAEPRLVKADGSETKLTDLKWKSATADWGQVRVNQNAAGGPLMIDGKPVEYGIGTHANSIIEYELPEGYVRFKARAGLDNGGTNQNGGNSTSVRFAVYTEKPSAIVAKAGGGAGNLPPAEALQALDVADGLEATLFAAEPLLLSPSNIDVDHRGRVWVCEVVNYRHRNGERPEGDRILILEDTDGDGRADRQTVFYQGRDIDSALGICVLGNRVIVSVAPNVFVFTDDNGDGRADRKELLFTNVGQPQHDHSAHAFVFGPDGKLYWNVGNTGHRVHDKDGKPIADLAGNVVNDGGNPYRQGMVFRCNLDASEFEVLGHNFRNNYEVAVDSFGTLWQSDNDDDGNRGVRINYVMEYGNFGYVDEFTGAGWKEPRTNLEAEVPLQHWHLNDPGVVPNLLNTGAGSPTGILVYEGDLLPAVFRNQMIHCDAGPNIVRAYPVENDGAGYKARIENILDGDADKWFRPSDVCVAPDGSLIVADWYDPGVGGHRMGDVDKGRLFRVAPPGAKYAIPKYDFKTVEGAIEALKSPNHEARYLAWTALHEMGEKAEPALQKLYSEAPDLRHRARALWLLSKIKGRGYEHAARTLDHPAPEIRITALRAIRQLVPRMNEFVSGAPKQFVEKNGAQELLAQCISGLSQDRSTQVRRECAVALRHLQSERVPEIWADLAFQHDGKDRWYLEALGIGAEGKWDACFVAWLREVDGKWNTPAGRDIVWRSRAAEALPLLAEVILDPQTGEKERLRYFRAFDFHRPQSEGGKAAKQQVLLALATASHPQQEAITALALQHLGEVNINSSPELKSAVMQALDAAKGTDSFVRLVGQFSIGEKYPDLLALAQQQPAEQLGVEAMRTLLAKNQGGMLEKGVKNSDPTVAAATVQALGNAADGRALRLLMPLLEDKSRPVEVRREAVRAVARTKNGADELLRRTSAKRLDGVLLAAAAAALHGAPWHDVKQKANELFPPPPSKNDQPLPPLAQLAEMKGDALKGRVVFNTTGTCAKCHVVGGLGKEVGPDLSEIGKKLSRQAFFESILYPSAGISHNYETWVLALESGDVINGLKVSETAGQVTIKGADALTRTFKRSEIEEMQKQDISLMPADLQKAMSLEELVDVVEYMTTLTQAEAAGK